MREREREAWLVRDNRLDERDRQQQEYRNTTTTTKRASLFPSAKQTNHIKKTNNSNKNNKNAEI